MSRKPWKGVAISGLPVSFRMRLGQLSEAVDWMMDEGTHRLTMNGPMGGKIDGNGGCGLLHECLEKRKGFWVDTQISSQGSGWMLHAWLASYSAGAAGWMVGM